MTMKTISYKRILPEVSVALLRDSETKKLCYRHRFRGKSKSVPNAGKQEFEDYPHKSKKYSNMEEFKQFIINKFDYE